MVSIVDNESIPTTMMVKCAPRLATILCFLGTKVSTELKRGKHMLYLVWEVCNANAIYGGRCSSHDCVSRTRGTTSKNQSSRLRS